jgi:hypothetical protein
LTLTIVLSFGMISAATAPAEAAKITVSQCINSWWRCSIGCPGYVDGPLPPSSNPAGDKNCRNRCDANHAACIDRAMDLSSRRAKTPRKRTSH